MAFILQSVHAATRRHYLWETPLRVRLGGDTRVRNYGWVCRISAARLSMSCARHRGRLAGGVLCQPMPPGLRPSPRSRVRRLSDSQEKTWRSWLHRSAPYCVYRLSVFTKSIDPDPGSATIAPGKLERTALLHAAVMLCVSRSRIQNARPPVCRHGDDPRECSSFCRLALGYSKADDPPGHQGALSAARGQPSSQGFRQARPYACQLFLRPHFQLETSPPAFPPYNPAGACKR